MTTKPPQELAVVDTNVWLDAFLPGRANAPAAQAFVRAALSRGVGLLYPIHTLPDIFYLAFIGTKRFLNESCPGNEEACARAARSTAWDVVGRVREVATALEAGEGDTWLACKQERLHNDLEDNLVLAATLRSRARWLVTSDAKLLGCAAEAGVLAIAPSALADALSRGGASAD